MWVRSLGQEDPLEEENGDPLQYSCLENPMDRGAWWAAVHAVTRSQDTAEHNHHLTSMHDYWKNHSYDYTVLCW